MIYLVGNFKIRKYGKLLGFIGFILKILNFYELFLMTGNGWNGFISHGFHTEAFEALA